MRGPPATRSRLALSRRPTGKWARTLRPASSQARAHRAHPGPRLRRLQHPVRCRPRPAIEGIAARPMVGQPPRTNWASEGQTWAVRTWAVLSWAVLLWAVRVGGPVVGGPVVGGPVVGGPVVGGPVVGAPVVGAPIVGGPVVGGPVVGGPSAPYAPRPSSAPAAACAVIPAPLARFRRRVRRYLDLGPHARPPPSRPFTSRAARPAHVPDAVPGAVADPLARGQRPLPRLLLERGPAGQLPGDRSRLPAGGTERHRCCCRGHRWHSLSA